MKTLEYSLIQEFSFSKAFFLDWFTNNAVSIPQKRVGSKIRCKSSLAGFIYAFHTQKRLGETANSF